MTKSSLKINGMSCQHCVMAVKKAIDAIDGVKNSDVQVGSATFEFDESKVKLEDIEAAVTKGGYKIVK